MFDGEESGHFGFAAGFEGVGEGFEAWVGAAGDEGGHVEDFAQEAVALAPDGTCAAHAAAALAEARGEAAPRGGGAGVGEVARQLRDEPARGLEPDAGDGAEPFAVGVQRGVRGEMFGDGGLDGGGFTRDVFLQARDAFAHDGIGSLGAAGFHLGEFAEGGEAAQQGAQCGLRGAGGLPEVGVVGEAVVGDDFGVEGVGLVAAAVAAGVVLDPARVEDAHGVARLVKHGGREQAVAAGGFHDDGERPAA